MRHLPRSSGVPEIFVWDGYTYGMIVGAVRRFSVHGVCNKHRTDIAIQLHFALYATQTTSLYGCKNFWSVFSK